MKTGRATFEAYFPETGQLKYEKNRQACGAKLKLDDAIEFIQYAETKILDDPLVTRRGLRICNTP